MNEYIYTVTIRSHLDLLPIDIGRLGYDVQKAVEKSKPVTEDYDVLPGAVSVQFKLAL